jgi:hypothetical protein
VVGTEAQSAIEADSCLEEVAAVLRDYCAKIPLIPTCDEVERSDRIDGPAEEQRLTRLMDAPQELRDKLLGMEEQGKQRRSRGAEEGLADPHCHWAVTR